MRSFDRSIRARILARRILATASLAALLAVGWQAEAAAQTASAARYNRAAALVRSGAFAAAAETLRSVLAAEPANRDARELLAFTLESSGDLAGERAVRSALAGEYPDDARVQADLGRVLERSADAPGAIRAYRRARLLDGGGSTGDLDAAIERLESTTAVEVAAPLLVISEPGASLMRAQAGAAIPVGARLHAALLATHYTASTSGSSNVTTGDAVSLSLVRRQPAGGYWAAGSSVYLSPAAGGRQEPAFGGMLAGCTHLGARFQANWHAELKAPWDEAAIAVLHGGRSTAGGAQLYSRSFRGRLLLQAGAQRRRLSMRPADGRTGSRPDAYQSLWLAGADVVLWSDPRAALRGEVLDEALRSPTSLASALTLAYRHYEAMTSAAAAFRALIDLVPRNSVDEVSVSSTLATPRRGLGLELHAGLGRDRARNARLERMGGALFWSPLSETRVSAGYEVADEVFGGLFGQRWSGTLSIHVDL